MIHGDRVTLRPATDADRRLVYEWMAETDLTPSMMGPPLFPEIPVPTWDEFCADYGPPFFDGSRPDLGRSYVIEVDGEAVGHVSYSGADPDGGRAELDVWLRSEAVCGRGYGSDALVALTRHLHQTLGLTEFIMRPSRRNPRAVRSYARAGFVVLPLRADEQDARYGPAEYHDTVVMCKRAAGEPAAGEPSASTNGLPMTPDPRFVSARFPRTSKYNPDAMLTHASSGSNTLFITEWLAEAMDLRPGMRVLDLASGRALSSIFLRREFGVQVWATDLWISATENLTRIRDCGVEDGVFPIHADARALPFAANFFDAITCVDSFFYFGTDDLYLNYLAQFVKPGGQIGVAGSGLAQEIDGPVPEHLREWWDQSMWGFQTVARARRQWERTGIVTIDRADTMPDGWQLWLDWQKTGYPDNAVEIRALEADAGRYIAYHRVVARRKDGVPLSDYCWPDNMRSFPIDYKKTPLLRGEGGS